MQTYIANKLIVNAKQMEEDFILNSDDGTFIGKSGDYIIHDNGKQRGCKRTDFETTFVRIEDNSSVKEHFKKLMEEGYKEMAKINLEIANEMYHMEEETDNIIKNEMNK